MKQELRSLQRQNNLAKWTAEVAECRSSGLTVMEWCEKNGMTPNTYFRHQRKVFEAMQQSEPFYEVPVERTVGRVAARIEVNGLAVEIHNGADEATIYSVVQAMKLC